MPRSAIAITSLKTAVALPQTEMSSVTWPATATRVRHAEDQTGWTCSAMLGAQLQVQQLRQLRVRPKRLPRRRRLPPTQVLQLVFLSPGHIAAATLIILMDESSIRSRTQTRSLLSHACKPASVLAIQLPAWNIARNASAVTTSLMVDTLQVKTPTVP